jgi:hypothetical protein
MRSLHILFCVLVCNAGIAQPAVGIFDHHTDIGHPKNAGNTTYDESSQTYTIRGSGYNIWFNRDEFQYAYKKIGGDFMLTANFEFSGNTKGSDAHRKIGWMIRESVDEGAACSNACAHFDGLTVLQWRPYRGMYMRDPEEEIFAPKKGGQIMRLERIGKKITMSIAHPGEPLQVVGSYLSDMKDSVLVGIYICAHDSNAVAEGRVWNVRIDKPVVSEYSSNPHAKAGPDIELPGYRLETMDILDGKRKVIHESNDVIADPHWQTGGKMIDFEVYGGAMYNIAADGGKPVAVNPSGSHGPVIAAPHGRDYDETRENSPDGKYVYYNADPAGTQQIWRMKTDGSDKEQLTFDEYHNWFPRISPDGKWVVFLSYPPDIDPNEHPRFKRVMLRIMPTVGGAPRVIARLYGGWGRDERPSWSPDSRYIAFISNSGMAMQ